MTEHRLVAGFTFAPFASALLQALVMGNLGAGMFALIVAYPFTIIIGAPSFLIFRKLGLIRPWQVISAGAFLGMLCGLMLMLLVDTEGFSWAAIMGGVAFIALHGLCISMSFWIISMRRNSSNSSLHPDATRW